MTQNVTKTDQKFAKLNRAGLASQYLISDSILKATRKGVENLLKIFAMVAFDRWLFPVESSCWHFQKIYRGRKKNKRKCREEIVFIVCVSRNIFAFNASQRRNLFLNFFSFYLNWNSRIFVFILILDAAGFFLLLSASPCDDDDIFKSQVLYLCWAGRWRKAKRCGEHLVLVRKSDGLSIFATSSRRKSLLAKGIFFRLLYLRFSPIQLHHTRTHKAITVGEASPSYAFPTLFPLGYRAHFLLSLYRKFFSTVLPGIVAYLGEQKIGNVFMLFRSF